MDMKKKSIIRRLIPWLVTLVALALLIAFVFVPIYSREERSFGRETSVFYYNGDGKELTMENDDLLFKMDAATTQFSVTNKATGKVWYSNPPDRANDSMARGVNGDRLSATLGITYIDSITTIELNNYTNSIINQCYNIFPQDDGSIRVDYAVGKIERIYMIPNAITQERYTSFTDKMEKKDRKKLSNYYSLYEPSKLDKKSNKDEIIALYPSVTEQALYILKDGLDAKGKAAAEGFFASVGYTAEDLAIDQELMAGEKAKTGPVFNVSVIYRLEGKDLVVEVPYSEITCGSDFPITYISLLPVFGAGSNKIDGFILVPEGGGSLINYNNGKVSQEAYYANMFGWDYGTKRTEVINETEVSFDVFGMSQPDGSFICILEGANSYGGISADVSGRLNDYNTVYAKYNVIHSDSYDVTSRSPRMMLMYENKIPDDTVSQRYRFLDGNGYVQMAKAYSDYLKAKPGMKQTEVREDLPVNIELVGAIDKKQVKFGVPVNAVVLATTFREAAQILDELTAADIRNLSVRMTGWANGGVRQKVLTSVHTVRQLGGDAEMKSLIARAREKGIDLYFDGISCFAYNSGVFNGFIPFRNASRFTTREVAKLYAYDIVTYRESDWMDPYYLVRPEYAASCAANLIGALKDRNAGGVAFRDIGNLLSADYYDGDTVTREQVKEMNKQTLRDADSAGLKISIKEGNEYALPYADLITDMDLTGNTYGMIDEKVPFYQMAIHGIKNYTGEAINLAGDYQSALLECAEYGAGLNFTFMKTDTMVLQDSNFSCYSSAGYDPWKAQTIAMINRYQREMAGLNAIEMTNHEKLSDGVSVTVYADGTSVYVNYTEADYNAGEFVVPARDYLVKRGGGQ